MSLDQRDACRSARSTMVYPPPTVATLLTLAVMSSSVLHIGLAWFDQCRNGNVASNDRPNPTTGLTQDPTRAFKFGRHNPTKGILSGDEDGADLAQRVYHQHVSGGRIRPPPTDRAVQHQTSQHRSREYSVDQRDPTFGS